MFVNIQPLIDLRAITSKLYILIKCASCFSNFNYEYGVERATLFKRLFEYSEAKFYLRELFGICNASKQKLYVTIGE